MPLFQYLSPPLFGFCFITKNSEFGTLNQIFVHEQQTLIMIFSSLSIWHQYDQHFNYWHKSLLLEALKEALLQVAGWLHKGRAPPMLWWTTSLASQCAECTSSSSSLTAQGHSLMPWWTTLLLLLTLHKIVAVGAKLYYSVVKLYCSEARSPPLSMALLLCC